ncbi:ABC transporter substrate-binding protein [Conexibacter woesei]|uniref:ABC transporter substrate-binding protein n=1 Tax=Conexibacter woesei TaxID=191495 RepID=UPI00042636AA|nr:ABC transporter substrate-binding protein [Conexibacter woesei]
MNRSAVTLLLTAALALAVATGCGSSDDDASSGSGAAATKTANNAGTFPVTVQHRYGATTIRSQPKRIAIVGFTEQDIVLALGQKPIVTTDWYGNQPYATWPWAREALGDARPTVLKAADGIDFEGVAKAHPDLIVGTNVGIKQKDYDKLSQIAPTVPGCKGRPVYFCPWDQQTELVAAALGQKARGIQMVKDIKSRFAKAAAEHPEFQGRSVTFSQNAFYDGRLYAYPPGLGTEFLSMLGFTINPKLQGLAKPGIQAAISAERLDVIDTDVQVFATEKPGDVGNLLKIPTFRGLNAVKGHHTIFTDATLSGAMYFTTPLSLPYVLDHLTPQLAAAVAGRAPRRMVS